MYTREKLIQLWRQFYTSHGFKEISSSSIIPENDPTVLFTTAGMHPLVPYLLGEKHPSGDKIFNIQRCLRTNDIDEVGDDSHLSLFEMLGNWTLGLCDKKAMIKLSFEFLTSRDYLNIPKEKIAVTVFEGDSTAPRDEEAYNAWKECGIEQIFYMPKKDNWWALGSGTGPCGPDSEMFYDTGKEKCCKDCNPSCNCGKYLEIWNDVFMQYKVEKEGEAAKPLDKPNIDTGMGLERTVSILNGEGSVYDFGALKKVIDFIGRKAKIGYDFDEKSKKSYRIITDHLKAATFILGDEKGVLPSNLGQGYVLRRFIRRAVNCARNIGFDTKYFKDIVDIFIEELGNDYKDILKNRQLIKDELDKEIAKFSKALEEGHREFEKVLSGIEKHIEFAAKNGESVDKKISGKAAFRLYDTFGFPFELTKELASERGFEVSKEEFDEKFKEHQEKSRDQSNKVFKGGLADSSKQSAYLHTATHLLLAALQHFYGKQVTQKGSNITPERLRFDFNLDHKMTKEELDQVENFVNDAIKASIPVVSEVMSLQEARNQGAHGSFSDRYGEEVKVYSIGNISKEICGGPHAENTSQLHHFKIIKEESCASGIRRIKAIID